MSPSNNNNNNVRRNPITSITSQGRQFKNHYLQLFSNDGSMRLRKELILKYHTLICLKNPLIRRTNRREARAIYHYFNSFASQENIILNNLRELIADGTVNYERDLESLRNPRT